MRPADVTPQVRQDAPAAPETARVGWKQRLKNIGDNIFGLIFIAGALTFAIGGTILISNAYHH